jgi:putative spermidine/putrescine transport system ATP-binding protein
MQRSLELTQVGKSYGSVTALHPTDLTIEAGEFLTLLGPSGSGKTTLLMTIAGFVEPSQGHILLDGADITAKPPEARNFGVVFQGYALFPHLTVWENVYFPLRARNISRDDARERVEDALDLMELGPYAKRMPRALSGGQQQRVALARALVFKPELLLLDEPLSALDKALRKSLQAELKSLHRKVGTTFVYVTHDQEEALSMSDRIAILRHGRIQQLDAPATLYERPSSEFVAGFLGRSNFIPGQVTESTGTGARVNTVFGSVTTTPNGSLATGSKATIVVRPEKLSLSAGEPDRDNRARGTITDLTYFGTHLEVEVDVAGVKLGVIMPTNDTTLSPGADVWLGWQQNASLLLRGEEDAA